MKYRIVLGLWLLLLWLVGCGRGSVEKPGLASPCPDADCGGRMEERGAEAGRGREGVR